jgi:hypothetical protein
MSRFSYKEGAVVAAPAADCVEAARRTLVEMGSKPSVSGSRVHGELGFFIRVRFVGAFWCPEKWLPLEVTADVLETPAGRQVVVDVAERFGFGSTIGMDTKYRNHCWRTAAYIRDTIVMRLAQGR